MFKTSFVLMTLASSSAFASVTLQGPAAADLLRVLPGDTTIACSHYETTSLGVKIPQDLCRFDAEMVAAGSGNPFILDGGTFMEFRGRAAEYLVEKGFSMFPSPSTHVQCSKGERGVPSTCTVAL